jgi:DNA-binding NarL/FixJ family response regulator
VIRVAIADDQALVLEGFAAILAAEPGIEVVGLAADGKQAIELARNEKLDVVVMDIRMPNLDGIAATERITCEPESPRVLVLTTFDADRLVFDAMRAGASGFLLKDAPPGRLARAVRDVAAGETLVDPAITRRLVERFANRPPPGPERPDALRDLSEREVEVLRGLGRGLSNSELAAELYLSPATVKTHVAAVLRKLRLRDRAQAVVAAYESGLIEPGA